MTNIEKYRQFCEKEKNIPIFSKDWWLDSVCGENNWDVVLVEKGGQIFASLPYLKREKMGFTMINMPLLTQTMGVYIKYPDGQKYYKKLSWEKDMMTQLIDGLPEFDSFNQNFHYSISNWLPFYWKGFEQTTLYTYVIDDLQFISIEDLFLSFDSSYKNKIRKARKTVKTARGMPIEEFYRINKLTFLRQDINIPYSLTMLMKHDDVLSKNNAREIFYAYDEEGNIHSALYLTWDCNSSYVHMVGEDPNLRNSSAGILLIYESIKYTKEVLELNSFDFEGSVLEKVEPVRRSFGAVQKPYFNITKTNSKILKIRKSIRNLI